MKFSCFVNGLTEYCFFWRGIRAIWSLWAVLASSLASKNLEQPLVLCGFGAQVAFLIVLSFVCKYHALIYFCQRSNGILLFLVRYPGRMEPLGGLGGLSGQHKSCKTNGFVWFWRSGGVSF